MPAIVVINASEIPAEKIEGSPNPLFVIESKESNTPITVPRSPNNGEIEAMIYTVFKPNSNFLIFLFIKFSIESFLKSLEFSLAKVIMSFIKNSLLLLANAITTNFQNIIVKPIILKPISIYTIIPPLSI